ncbi:Cel3e putative secreted beta-glucosidase [Microdochium bolleyi]|uniref:Beta-glucosidase cel3A n=1 Tax=Microdochium bolleyi TaxID=196109 RepID=A0A136ITJ3_9PEZI|nr:Cel3e putative secreted beta-glucosidase [Microdochium bolleyi]
MRRLSLFVLPALASSLSDLDFYGQSPPVYPSPQGNGANGWESAYDSARDLMAQMAFEEVVNITRGFKATTNTCAGNTGTVPRLGWPGMCLMDAGNGVRGTDLVNAYASGIHVGASWDKNLTYQRGWFMAKEFKAKGINVLLGPNAGPLGRVPVAGRNWEGFSVDPYLTGILAAESIRGHQDAGVIANLKHFVGNEQETYRRPYFGVEAVSSNIDDTTLHEFYAWPFMDGVHANVSSIMCSYQRTNNSYGCQNSKLMNGVLKTEFGFNGFIVADWNGQHSGVGSALAGLDMTMPYGGYWGDNLTEAVHNGSVPMSRVEDMAVRILAAWYKAGQNGTDFPEPGIGMKNLSLPHDKVDARNPQSNPVNFAGAVAGHVLVKNTNNTIPFKGKQTMLSVFGYDAASPRTKNTDVLFQLGYYSSPEMAQVTLGTEQHFDQAARGGTIISGGRAAANGPSYIIDPLSALSHRAMQDDTWLNWDIISPEPDVNPSSDACLVFINAIATEGWDRDGLHDDYSDSLVMNVASKCANTIVIIHNAGPRLVDQWIDHENVTATIFAHLPGQYSGKALVSLLYGEENFSGKLPYTVPRNESDYSVYAPCGRAGPNDNFPQCDFTEGVYLDYRDFDAKNVAPRFEFGFGLSYTTFNYSSLRVTKEKELVASGQSGDKVTFDQLWDTLLTVQVDITNTGPVAGEEVSQLYLGIPNRPIKQLRGFEKTRLAPGETATVEFVLTRRDVSIWHVVSQAWLVQEGEYTVHVGASSRDICALAVVNVPG